MVQPDAGVRDPRSPAAVEAGDETGRQALASHIYDRRPLKAPADDKAGRRHPPLSAKITEENGRRGSADLGPVTGGVERSALAGFVLAARDAGSTSAPTAFVPGPRRPGRVHRQRSRTSTTAPTGTRRERMPGAVVPRGDPQLRVCAAHGRQHGGRRAQARAGVRNHGTVAEQVGSVAAWMRAQVSTPGPVWGMCRTSRPPWCASAAASLGAIWSMCSQGSRRRGRRPVAQQNRCCW